MSYPPQGFPVPTLAYDTEGTDISSDPGGVTCSWKCENQTIAAGGDYTFFSKTLTCAQTTVLFGFAAGNARTVEANVIKLRLFINGIQVAEGAYLPFDCRSYVFMEHLTVSAGNRIVRLDGHNYSGGSEGGQVSGAVGGCCSKV